MKHLKSNWLAVVILLVVATVTIREIISYEQNRTFLKAETLDSTWVAPSLYIDAETQGKEREMVIYGQKLVANTGTYFGPKGSVAVTSNGMACQNCHLDAGKRAWGNNYGAVYANYPKFRDRSGSVEDVYKRINDCFERSLNGKPLDTTAYEMQAIAAYINWLGKEVPKGTKPYGSGLEKLPYLDRAADPQKGRIVFINNCQRCHGANGEGVLAQDSTRYTYPPLWGPHSYNDGAGLYRLSGFASFVKNNMPFGEASHQAPTLTTEEAWDVAAFVNSQPRPHKDQAQDWPDRRKKPVDFPFGPYADTFSEQQHKYGPFLPIEAARKSIANNKPQ